ncbi:MAG TPA: GTPase [Phycisphaerae bacterium]|nr:GTPase [Phycisphaerae bacterium]
MPANLTPDYLNAEKVFRAAKTVAERIAALEQMLATIPKHKGTEHIQGDIKGRLAKLRRAAQQQKGRGGFDPFHVEKSGAGQVALVGTPNAGKSALVAAVTKARVNVAPYPFATHAPAPGMMPFEDVQVQLVDLPPVTADGFVPGMVGAIRNADALLLCLDLSSDDVLEQAEVCLGVLAGRGIVRPGEEVPEGGTAKPMLVVGTKADLPGAEENRRVLEDLRPDLAPVLATSAATGAGFEELPPRCFEMLDVIRVYSKEPGKPPDLEQPFILPRGSTVMDLAAAVHREVAESLKRARIWGSEKYDGQPVQRDHLLVDKDVIELHV